ncbi:MAG: M20/M25/M40 family metallo-hydrolase [Planctomycetaceae bacterium]
MSERFSAAPVWKAAAVRFVASIPMAAIVVLLGCGIGFHSVSAKEPSHKAVSRAAVIERVGDDIRYFASDELQGRGIETRGIQLAADRILEEYVRHGLKPGMPDGSYKQPFEIAVGKTDITADTDVVLTNSDGQTIRLSVGSDFQPLRRGMNGRGTGELVFVGYGITSKDDSYDDYASLDVAGKVVVMIRREPNMDGKGTSFEGTKTSSHAFIDRKLQLAREHNVAGILFVNDPYTTATSKTDELTPPHGFGNQEVGVPFAHITQAVINGLLKTTPLKVRHNGEVLTLSNLAQVGEFIDANLQPVSQPLTGWSAEVRTHFDTQSVTAYNLVGVLEGEGALADETVVVGAHYDHLGFGGYGSRSPDRKGEIHNGADDNATGTAAVLELIRRMTAGPKPKRRIVFICFSGEEKGLLGSGYYVKNPAFPLEKTVTMLNFDMIGTLRDNKVEVNGVATAIEFADIVQAADEASELDVTIVTNPFGGSDHLPFFRKNIPVMFCFTGITSRYHTPDDDFEQINVPGVVSVVDLSERILNDIVNLPVAPEFRQVSRNGRATKIPYLGIIPNLGADRGEAGVPIQGVRPESPARRSGLQVGDVILKAGSTSVTDYPDLLRFLMQSNAGQEIPLSVRRNGEELVLNATLGAPR